MNVVSKSRTWVLGHQGTDCVITESVILIKLCPDRYSFLILPSPPQYIKKLGNEIGKVRTNLKNSYYSEKAKKKIQLLRNGNAVKPV